jgi:hypothetical protein
VSNNGTGKKLMSLDAIGERLAQAAQKVPREHRRILFEEILFGLQQPVGQLENAK